MKVKKINKYDKKFIKKVIKKKIEFAIVHILNSFNNTIITITDNYGKTISWATSRSVGFKGSKKSSIYAAQLSAESAGKKAFYHGVRTINIIIKGPGLGRDSSIRGLSNIGFKIISITDLTPIPHNGCKPRKIRRI